LDPLDSNIAPASYLFEVRTFGGTGPYTSHWDFGDGQEVDRQIGDGNYGYVYHTYENPGSYTLTLTVTDATGQTASDSISPLTVVPPPTEGEPTTTNDTGVETAAPPTTGGGTVSPEPEGGETTPPPQTTIDTLGQ
jgi:PKD repeat protein